MNQLLSMIAFVTARVNVSRDEAKDRGATATEYALLVALIAVAIAVAVGVFGSNLSDFFDAIGTKVSGWTSSAK